MKPTLRNYAELVRLPNVFTAMADVLAGYFFAGGIVGAWRPIVVLAVASACFYAGGVALNDVCDAPRDAAERPFRPIPSGRISRRQGVIVSVGLLAFALLFAALAGVSALIVAALLVVMICLYDALLKETALAPVVMGACRSLNLLLGMTAAAPLPFAQATVPAVLLALYVASVTYFARGEAQAAKPLRLKRGTIGASLAVAGLTTLPWVKEMVHWTFLAPTAAMLVWVACCGRAAWSDPRPLNVQRAVGVFVTLIIVFDACLVWASRGPVLAMGVAVVLVPVLILRRAIPMS